MEKDRGHKFVSEVKEMQATPRRSDIVVADPSRCHGCGICGLVCSLSHRGACGPALSSISLLRDPLAGEFLVETCRQCDFPACYFSCPFGAILVDDKTGARVIDGERCEGCGLCARACPYNEGRIVVKADPAKGTYFKCDLCTSLGRSPLCVEACPWGALSHVLAAKR